MTNVAKILLLQVFFNIRRKLFDFQTFMNQTHIINSTDIIIYFTDTYYLYYSKFGGLSTHQRFFAYNWNWQHDNILFFTNYHNCSAIYSYPIYIRIWYIHTSMYLYHFIDRDVYFVFSPKVNKHGAGLVAGWNMSSLSDNRVRHRHSQLTYASQRCAKNSINVYPCKIFTGR